MVNDVLKPFQIEEMLKRSRSGVLHTGEKIILILLMEYQINIKIDRFYIV